MKRLLSTCVNPAVSIFGLALITRIFYNLIVARDYYPLHDSFTYQSIAFNLLREHCYCLLPHLSTVDRAPLWPGIIAAIYGIFGAHDRTVRLFLSVAGSATCTLTYCFARDLFGKRPGIFAGLLAANYPFLYVYDGWLYPESLYTFLLLAFCYTLYRFQHNPGRKLVLLAGVLCGLVSLTRPNGLAVLALFLLWIIIVGKARLLPWRYMIKGIVIVSLVSLTLVVPWIVRNYVITGAFVPVAVGDGKVLLGAYNDMILQRPYYLGIWIIPDESVSTIARRFPVDCAGDCEVRRDNAYRYYAEQWIAKNLAKMPYLLRLHFVHTWQTTSQEADLAINRFPERPASQIVVVMMEVVTPIVFVLALSGLIVTRKRWRELLFMYLLIAFTIVQNCIFYGIPRFRAPLEPMLIILASGGVWWIALQMGERHKVRSRVAAMIESRGRKRV